MPSAGRVLVLVWIVVVACDDAPAPAEPPRVLEAAPVPDAAEHVGASEQVRPSAPVVGAAEPSEAIVEPPPPESAGDETFEALVARLVEDVPPTPDPGTAAFVHYRAKAFGKAQALFALAAREDPAPCGRRPLPRDAPPPSTRRASPPRRRRGHSHTRG